MKPLNKRTANTKGFTLIEVTIAIFILSLIMVGFSATMKLFQSDVKRTQLVSSRSDIGSIMRMNLKEPSTIFNSAAQPMNTELNDCLGGTTNCTHLQTYDMNLYSSVLSVPSLNPDGTPVLDANNKPIFLPEPIAGASGLSCPTSNSSKFPVFYTKDGRRCDCTEPATMCPLQAISQFQAFCPAGNATCTIPAAVKILYQIQVRSDLPTGIESLAAVSLSTQTGGVLVSTNELTEEQQIRFSFATSYMLAGATSSAKTVDSNLTAFDISMGKALPFNAQPAFFVINANFNSIVPVSKVELYRYNYPAGCDLANIGSKPVIGGSTVDCSIPVVNQFSLRRTFSLSTAQKSLSLKFDDDTSQPNLIEYRLKALDAASGVVAESIYPLRAVYKQGDSIKLEGPDTIKDVCGASTYNTITITAKAFSGWKSISAESDIVLTYTDGSGNTVTTKDIPGFSSFNKDSIAPQSIVLDYKNFASVGAGNSFKITLSGITNDDNLVTTSRSFVVGAPPPKTITLDNPVNNSQARTKYPLDIGVTLNLACNENPTTVKNLDVWVTEFNTSAFNMNKVDISSSCTAVTGGADENKFYCKKTFSCSKWMGTADDSLCASKYSADTELLAHASYTTADGVALGPVANKFTAGAKVTFYLHKNYTKFYLLKIYAIPTVTPMKVKLSAQLMPAEDFRFKLTDGSTTQSFSCKNGGGGNATYNAATLECSFNMVTPTSGTTFNLESGDPDVFASVAPNVLSFVEVTASDFSCNSQAGHPVCDSGETLKADYIKLGTYDMIPGNSATTDLVKSMKLLANPRTTVDAFLYYQPLGTITPDFSIVTSQKLANSDGSFSEVKYHFPISGTIACSGAVCPADGIWVTSIDSSKLRASFGSENFSIEGLNKTAGAGAAIGNASVETIIVRQCYCQ